MKSIPREGGGPCCHEGAPRRLSDCGSMDPRLRGGSGVFSSDARRPHGRSWRRHGCRPSPRRPRGGMRRPGPEDESLYAPPCLLARPGHRPLRKDRPPLAGIEFSRRAAFQAHPHMNRPGAPPAAVQVQFARQVDERSTLRIGVGGEARPEAPMPLGAPLPGRHAKAFGVRPLWVAAVEQQERQRLEPARSRPLRVCAELVDQAVARRGSR